MYKQIATSHYMPEGEPSASDCGNTQTVNAVGLPAFLKRLLVGHECIGYTVLYVYRVGLI